jgi:adenosylcobinamide-GDP ribazoletransferase
VSKIRNILGDFVTAIRTLTILPVPGAEAECAADAMYFFPLVGAIVGGAVQGVVWIIAGVLDWQAGAAFAGVVLLVWLTRALHLDGLGDTVDAFFGGATRERRLEIMKDPHIGAFGAAAIILALLCRFTALERLSFSGHWTWIVLPVVLSRTIMVLTAVSLPYARAEGGKAQPFVAGARLVHFWFAFACALLICLLYCGSIGLSAAAVALALGVFWIWWMKRAFGGVTGDLLGFAGETTECVLYFILALFSVY